MGLAISAAGPDGRRLSRGGRRPCAVTATATSRPRLRRLDPRRRHQRSGPLTRAPHRHPRRERRRRTRVLGDGHAASAGRRPDRGARLAASAGVGCRDVLLHRLQRSGVPSGFLHNQLPRLGERRLVHHDARFVDQYFRRLSSPRWQQTADFADTVTETGLRCRSRTWPTPAWNTAGRTGHSSVPTAPSS